MLPAYSLLIQHGKPENPSREFHETFIYAWDIVQLAVADYQRVRHLQSSQPAMAALKAMGDCTPESSGATHQNQIVRVITGHYCYPLVI